MQGRTIIVTGGGRDIGRAITLKLAALGCNVVMSYWGSNAEAEETLALAKKKSPQTLSLRADATSPQDASALVDAALTSFGAPIHGLVNVAGGLVARRPLAQMDKAFLEEVMRLNVTSTFVMTAAVAPHLQSGGAIVNFSSQAGRDGGGGGASAYAAAKGAVMSFTRAMAKELGPSGVRVNALCAGMIGTSFHDTFTSSEVRQRVAAATPLRREGRAEEVAAAAAFLLSDEASFITGACVDINGGALFS
jgi:3-oxoacyl-[acyl-carrier protein] reductase